MKNLVISASLSLDERISYWVKYFNNLNYNVLNYPKKINENNFLEIYPSIYRDFLESIIKADTLFIMNEDKNGVKGYIGSAVYAELCFAIAQNLIYDKNIEIYLYQMPSVEVSCYNEIKLWLELDKIKIWNN
ncbi:MAG: hypothetical protein HFI36_05635 [Bacilli bacterium]|jgi:hypothetical protein|nr:hypothetical protein [Bacilli bacterium]MCX4254829.1 hypothetical protein [Bacilli bacterium]